LGDALNRVIDASWHDDFTSEEQAAARAGARGLDAAVAGGEARIDVDQAGALQVVERDECLAGHRIIELGERDLRVAAVARVRVAERQLLVGDAAIDHVTEHLDRSGAVIFRLSSRFSG
jgi:hypothetical protein